MPWRKKTYTFNDNQAKLNTQKPQQLYTKKENIYNGGKALEIQVRNLQ